MPKTKYAIIFLFMIGTLCFAQTSNSLDEGKQRFANGDYQNALVSFRAVVMNPSSVNAPEAYYWIVLTEISLKDYVAAEKAATDLLNQYPQDSRAADVLYQKGRAVFLQNKYDESIQIFQTFMTSYPKHAMFSSALYWIGEAFFNIGQYEYAQKAFQTIIDSYPQSVKYEAAVYRISLIQYKLREEELLKLLKWSHEESLKTIEELQRREKTYEQAILVYQKKIDELSNKAAEDELRATINDLQKNNAALAESNAEKDKEIADLNKKLQDAQAALDKAQAELEILKNQSGQAATSQSKTTQPEASTKPTASNAQKDELLELKEEALALEELYLEWLSINGAGK